MKTIIKNSIKLMESLPMPITLLGVCIFSYGLLIPWLGYYQDDWYIVLFQKYIGLGEFSYYLVEDRPLLGYIYQLLVPILKDSIFAWQLFALFSHYFAVCMFWWLLSKLMPKRERIVAAAALLFAVYPGFQFHWFSVKFGVLFFLMAMFFLSYILMFRSINSDRGKVLYIIGGLVCLVIGIFPQEYYFGLELMRPFILWVFLVNQNDFPKKRISQFFAYWMPYLVVGIGFVVYRLTFSKSFSIQVTLVDLLTKNPKQALLRLVVEIFQGTMDALLTIWTNLFQLFKRDLFSFVSLVMLVLILIGFGIAFLWLKRYYSNDLPNQKPGWIVFISLMATIFAMVPFLMASVQISSEYPNNQYLLALAPSACLFTAIIINSLLNTNWQRLLLISIFIGLSIGSQFITARSLMLNWQAQQDFFWQLSWRAPAISPNTILISEDLPFSRYLSSSSMTAPLNLIYSPDQKALNIPYLFVLNSQQEDLIESYSPNQSFSTHYHAFNFSGNTSDLLVFKKAANKCLRIISPNENPEEFEQNAETGFWKSVIPLSNPSLILIDSDKQVELPQQYFGKENRNQWCYYFEKADLARQQGDWSKTIQWYMDAEKAGFESQVDAEFVPLVDAYINMGRLEDALKETVKVTNLEPFNTAPFCVVWEKAAENIDQQDISLSALSYLKCKTK